MNKSLENLALRKQLLQARSTLCRLRIRYELNAMHDTLSWAQAGVMGLIYGGFSYTKETHTAKLGPLEINVQEKETVIVPVIASAGAIALGVFLIVAGRNK